MPATVPIPADGADLVGGDFSALVTAITSAFGDPTRRAVYLFARASERGVSASAVAEHFELHTNVARHHLDKLAGGGYLEVDLDREQLGAGRPSKRYRVTARFDGDALGSSRTRLDNLVLSLLGRTLALLPPEQAEAVAEDVGREYGESLAKLMSPAEGQHSLRSAIRSVADALTAHGFAAHAEQRNSELRIVQEHCPFGANVVDNPVLCAVDRGMVRGMLGALYGETDPARAESLARGDHACVTVF